MAGVVTLAVSHSGDSQTKEGRWAGQAGSQATAPGTGQPASTDLRTVDEDVEVTLDASVLAVDSLLVCVVLGVAPRDVAEGHQLMYPI